MFILLAHKVLALVKNIIQYFSPYEVKHDMPPIIIYNRSSYARTRAIDELLDAFGTKVRIIEVLPKGKTPHPKVDRKNIIEVTDSNEAFANPASLTAPLEAMGITLTQLSESDAKAMKSYTATDDKAEKAKILQKPMLYGVWSAQAEEGSVGKTAQKLGFTWLGSNPDAMEKIGPKISFKRECKKTTVKTADFFVLAEEAPENNTNANDLSDAELKTKIDALYALFIEKYAQNTEFDGESLQGGAIFLKSSYGGGGRGTVFIKDPSNEKAVRDTLMQVIKDTGKTDGIYAEKALNLDGATLMQLEVEVDGGKAEKHGRIVFFNKNNQKVMEIGIHQAFAEKLISTETFQQCIEQSEALARGTNYDGRGTCEWLIAKFPDGKCRAWASEFNCRIQVEHEAFSNLQQRDVLNPKTEKIEKRFKNVPAEMAMRALGYPAPDPSSDYEDTDHKIVLHVRLTNGEPRKTDKWTFPKAHVLGHSKLPKGVDIVLNEGPINTAADAQIGRVLIYADNWEDMCGKLDALGNMTIAGVDGPISTSLQAFWKKMAASPTFIGYHEVFSANGTEAVTPPALMGCDKTGTCLDLGKQEVPVHDLQVRYLHTLANVMANGFARGANADRYLSLAEMTQVESGLQELDALPDQEDGILTHFQGQDLDKYYAALTEKLDRNGGGMTEVGHRDTVQERYQSQSGVISHLTAKVIQKTGGFLVGSESGGAQFEVANRNGIDCNAVFLDGFSGDIPNRTLVRSEWGNSLNSKTEEEQDFIIGERAKAIRVKLGLDADAEIPWFPNNFHAGNHPDQDITTALYLNHKIQVVPNWSWDPRYSDEQFDNWIDRQLDLFETARKPLREIRIKNPGQQNEWTADLVMQKVKQVIAKFKARGLDAPIIHIHNHNNAGNAGNVMATALKTAQAQGYRRLVVDVAPTDTTHNDIMVVADALEFERKEREQIAAYNKHMSNVLKLIRRFDVGHLKDQIIPPNSKWASGTASSDIKSAKELGIPVAAIYPAKRIGWEITGLGTIVTPFSEMAKRVGYALWNEAKFEGSIALKKQMEALSKELSGRYQETKALEKKIQNLSAEETDELRDLTAQLEKLNAKIESKDALLESAISQFKAHVIEFIDRGGKLKLDPATIRELYYFKTDLEKPRWIETLLQNYGFQTVEAEVDKIFGISQLKEMGRPFIDRYHEFVFAIWSDEKTQKSRSNTAIQEDIAKFINPNEVGHRLKLRPNFLKLIQEWTIFGETPKPENIKKLLIKAGWSVEASDDITPAKIDTEKMRAALNEKYPNLTITDTVIADVLEYGVAAHNKLAKENAQQDLTHFLANPKLLLDDPQRLRESNQTFTLLGTEFKIESVNYTPSQAKYVFTFQNQESGEIIEVPALNKAQAVELGIIKPPRMKNPQNENEAATMGDGQIIGWAEGVTLGYTITAENCITIDAAGNEVQPEKPLAMLEITKQKMPLALPASFIGKTITELLGSGEEIVRNGWILTAEDSK